MCVNMKLKCVNMSEKALGSIFRRISFFFSPLFRLWDQSVASCRRRNFIPAYTLCVFFLVCVILDCCNRVKNNTHPFYIDNILIRLTKWYRHCNQVFWTSFFQCSNFFARIIVYEASSKSWINIVLALVCRL